MKTITIPCVANPGCLPQYRSEGASGADLKADVEDKIRLRPSERKLIPTGIWLQLPPGYEAQIRPRSGLAYEFGVTLLNAPGTIDSDYRGEVKVVLVNLGSEDFVIRRGDRIAQIVFSRVASVNFDPRPSLEGTTRGEGGFGSTGLK
jgi:dUTP pyrophosphatase